MAVKEHEKIYQAFWNIMISVPNRIEALYEFLCWMHPYRARSLKEAPYREKNKIFSAKNPLVCLNKML